MVTAAVAFHIVNYSTPRGAFTQGFGYGRIVTAGHACNHWHGMWVSGIIAHAKISNANFSARALYLDSEASARIVTGQPAMERMLLWTGGL